MLFRSKTDEACPLLLNDEPVGTIRSDLAVQVVRALNAHGPLRGPVKKKDLEHAFNAELAAKWTDPE